MAAKLSPKNRGVSPLVTNGRIDRPPTMHTQQELETHLVELYALLLPRLDHSSKASRGRLRERTMASIELLDAEMRTLEWVLGGLPDDPLTSMMKAFDEEFEKRQ